MKTGKDLNVWCFEILTLILFLTSHLRKREENCGKKGMCVGSSWRWAVRWKYVDRSG